MNMIVWKATLEPKNVQAVRMPRGAIILSAQAQDNRPTIWFLCDSDEPMEERSIALVTTGYTAPHPSEATFIGTVQLSGGSVVVHVFERTP